MIILRLGLTSLICGAMNTGSIIIEPGPERDSDHQAILRLRTDNITKLLNIPTKGVTVYKSIWYDHWEVQPTPRMLSLYSKKVTGRIESRSILDISPKKRFIPPKNLYSILLEMNNIKYNTELALDIHDNCPIVSTMHMPELARELEYDLDSIGQFNYKPIYVTKYLLYKCDSYATIYYPGKETFVYRASLNQNELIIESSYKFQDNELGYILDSFGLHAADVREQVVNNHKQKYGKISEINNDKRNQFITKLTLDHNIYSLGRFATWRPKVMLDDVIDDVQVIRRLIQGGKYSALKHNSEVK